MTLTLILDLEHDILTM